MDPKDLPRELSRLADIYVEVARVLGDSYAAEPAWQVFERVTAEQFELADDGTVCARDRKDVGSGSLQSPDDVDATYNAKNGKPQKGHKVNVTETAAPQNELNLITDVAVDRATASDHQFVRPAIVSTTQVTGQHVDTVHADGAYQSPDNDKYLEDIDMVYTGLQGTPSRYDLEMTPHGLMVTDTQTGECIRADVVKKKKNSKQTRWRIKTAGGYRYFNRQAIRASRLRREMKQRPLKELHKRNNVEATIFQFCLLLRNNKSRYRGRHKIQSWAYARCIWINLVRIKAYTKRTCQRTCQSMENAAKSVSLGQILEPFWSCWLRYNLKFAFEM
jgi:hypothetical protein